MSRTELSRRRLLGGGAAALGAIGAGAAVSTLASSGAVTGPAGQEFGRHTVPFFGDHQAGIETPPQAHAVFIALDLRPGSTTREAISILKLWTADAARLTAGAAALADTEPELATSPSRLTVTVGFGPTLFERLRLQSPASVRPLPSFGIDALEPEWGGGDLLLQLCCDDPTTLAHAQRVLLKNTRKLATIRWIQRGFRPARGAHPDGQTMRNLMGSVDGTVNPRSGSGDFADVVWAGPDQGWLAGGTTMVIRRIRVELDTWDELDRHGRDLAIGRHQDTGAPLTGSHEDDEPDFAATKRGIPVIPANSHIARAHAKGPRERFLRRAYNFDDVPSGGATTNAGLIFTTFQRDIDTQFIPVQQRLAEADLLNEWTTPIGSAVFAIPPGVAAGRYLGHQLFES
ncbi:MULTISPECIES: Dyp-type peroxidase [unclassified Gordonia (in: high G+C Gram-positive bacteria)]|uniref:Dyp-type peroxidase n=1 Tax=unclassified Gordonia (in: high G+C Gram-positive bacteria) TaxID=2657482 RepID=UPI001F0F4A26|nr:Dyp-type peroxidase [Gordonia sp. ABSL49_1]MCH5643609.1 Dyp-type peroxidase [Gordonia sp. ABSL49_1]